MSWVLEILTQRDTEECELIKLIYYGKFNNIIKPNMIPVGNETHPEKGRIYLLSQKHPRGTNYRCPCVFCGNLDEHKLLKFGGAGGSGQRCAVVVEVFRKPW